MAAGLLIPPKYPGVALDGDGAPVSGARLYTYVDGAPNSPKPVYADSGLTTPLSNPVTADASGVWPLMYASLGSYFTVLASDANDAPLNGGAYDHVGVTTDATTGAAALAMAAAMSAQAIAQQLTGYWLGNRVFSNPQTITQPIVTLPGALITVDGCTLTFGASFQAGLGKVFNCINGGRVKFADGAVHAVHPEWWGFGASAAAAVNDAARIAARDSIMLRGTVLFPPGAFTVTAYVPINRSYIRFVGDARFGTVFTPTAGAGDITGIDGTYAPGFVDGPNAAQIDECQHLGISVFRSDSQTASGSFDGARLPTVIPTGSRGFVHRLAANSIITGKIVGSPIDYYESRTSGGQVDIYTVRQALTGDSAATLRFGTVSDCTVQGPQNTSANGSSYKRVIDYCGGFVGESWAALSYGSDLRDAFWNSIETAFSSHALDVICTGSTRQAWDIHVNLGIFDTWSKSGVRLRGLPAGSKFNLQDGYSTPALADPTLPASVDIANCSGVIIGHGFEAKGGLNYADHVGVRLSSGSARCRVFCTISGVRQGIVVDAGVMNLISPAIEPLVSQPIDKAICLQNGTTRTLVTGALVDGVGGATYGVWMDASSTYNTVGPCDINPGTVTNPVYMNGVNRTAPGAYNHNRLLDGTVDNGL